MNSRWLKRPNHEKQSCFFTRVYIQFISFVLFIFFRLPLTFADPLSALRKSVCRGKSVTGQVEIALGATVCGILFIRPLAAGAQEPSSFRSATVKLTLADV